jgi:hypothetical protein
MGRSASITAAAAAIFGLAAMTGIAATGAPDGAPAAAAFRLADGSVACNFRDSGNIVCRGAGRAEAVVLEPGGTTRLEPAAVVSWNDTTPVLLAAESWWNGAVSCRVSGPRVVCSTGAGSVSVGPARSK